MKIYSIKFYFKGSNNIVPFNYYDDLVGFLHGKILKKDNLYHDNTSLYSISPLFNSKTVDNGLIFEKGAIWTIRTPKEDVFKDIYLKSKNIIGEELSWGLVLNDVSFKTKEFNHEEILVKTSPIFLGQNKLSTIPEHITYKHGLDITTEHLKRIFITKSKKCGYDFNNDEFNIEFDLTTPIKTKSVKRKKSINIVTDGKIKIKGNPNIIGLCYGFGVGLSTGYGFGYLFEHNF